MPRRHQGPLLSSRVALAALTVTLLGVMGLYVPAAQAGPRSGSTAAVTMGDSYISGEAGRWLGNSIDSLGSRDRTDRACVYKGGSCASYDRSKVYVGGSAADKCHRSDVAELLSARLAVDRRFNIACSGAVTENLFRSVDGGVGQNGEPAQADQLGPIAKAYRVKLIVVSIGGNDLGFASIIAACLEHYEAKLGPCEPSQQAAISAKLPAAIAGIEKAVDEIRAVMRAAGYAQADYRLVLQTYPTVVPRAADARYPELGVQRTLYGCPFYDPDLTWAHDHAGPEIGGAVKLAAAARGVELLDLGHAFDGHEFCAKTTSEATPSSFPSPAGAEWGRFLSASAIQQGDEQEVFHPDAYGQQALGTCLASAYALTAAGDFSCTGSAGVGPGAMKLTRTATFVDHPTIDVGSLRGCVAVRTTLRVAVGAAQPLPNVTVRLDGRTIKKTQAAQFTLVIRLKPSKRRSHRVTITVSDSTGGRAVRTITLNRCAAPRRHSH